MPTTAPPTKAAAGGQSSIAPVARPTVSSLAPGTTAQGFSVTVTIHGEHFAKGARLFMTGGFLKSSVESEAVFVNSTTMTISTALQASDFPRLPFSNFSSQLEVSVRNPDGQASEGVNLRVIGVLDMVAEGRMLGTVSMSDGIAAARAVGVRVNGDGRCPGITEFTDPDTNKVLLSISCFE